MALSNQLISGDHLWWGRVPEIGDRQRATHSVVAVIAIQAGYPVILILLHHFNVITAESIFDVFAIHSMLFRIDGSRAAAVRGCMMPTAPRREDTNLTASNLQCVRVGTRNSAVLFEAS